MATEPVGTSARMDPKLVYTPPVGRLPVLGKVRAEIEKLFAEAANNYNQIVNRDLAQIDSNAKITEEITASQARTTNETAKTNSDSTYQAGRLANETYKTNAEVSALNQQTINDTTKTVNDTTRTTNDTNKTSNDITNSTNKTAAEVALLEQKTETELAQVVDTVTTGAVAGVIGKQKVLYQNQANGFIRDAEQKLAKIMADTWSVRYTTDTADANNANLGETDVAAVLLKAQQGILAVP